LVAPLSKNSAGVVYGVAVEDDAHDAHGAAVISAGLLGQGTGCGS
jgi:hypothetical protein